MPPSDKLHLVFGANAGLPATPAWMPTLQELLVLSRDADTAMESGGVVSAPPADINTDNTKQACPVVFSDYCEEAVVESCHMVKACFGVGFGLQCCVNPFRQPVGTTRHGTRLPACSNGFLFGWL